MCCVKPGFGGETIRNLLSGVTTVSHPSPYLPQIFETDFPVHVLSEYGWLRCCTLSLIQIGYPSAFIKHRPTGRSSSIWQKEQTSLHGGQDRITVSLTRRAHSLRAQVRDEMDFYRWSQAASPFFGPEVVPTNMPGSGMKAKYRPQKTRAEWRWQIS